MRPHAWLAALGASLAACGGASPLPFRTSARDPDRVALVARLCDPLPRRAYECVVSWPAAVGPSHRDALEIASEGSFWARGPGVRAYASCTDRAAEEGHVAEVVVILVDTSVTTPEALAERLPIPGVRWSGECTSGDECRSYLGQVDGDRLVLRRRVERPVPTDESAAHLACSAVVDGAEQARARIDAEGAIVREVDVREAGVRVSTRRSGGRGGTDETYRSWRELTLRAGDERIERAADVRQTTLHPPLLDPERVDVTSLGLVERQIAARRAQLDRGRSPEALGALARLAARAFEAHPSHPDYATLAVELALEIGDTDAAASVARDLSALVGERDLDAARLRALVAITTRDPSALAEALVPEAPELSVTARATIAEALIARLGPVPLTRHAIEGAAAFTRVFVAATRAASVPMRRRSAVSFAPASGAGWALLALAGATGTDHVVVCGDGGPARGEAERGPTPRGTPLTIATLGACAAAEVDASSPLDLGPALAALLPMAQGSARVLIAQGDAWIGVGGRASLSTLEVDRATATVVHADLARARDRVAAPLASIGTRVFPPPTLHVPVPTTEREAALSAASSSETVCALETQGVACTPRAGQDSDVLFATALRIFAAE